MLGRQAKHSNGKPTGLPSMMFLRQQEHSYALPVGKASMMLDYTIV